MNNYFHNLFLSQKYLANLPEPDDVPPVPGDDTGGGGPVVPPTFTPGFVGYSVPRYTCNVVANDSMAVMDFVNDVVNTCARMYISQGYNGKIRLHNKKPVTWGLATAATSVGATSISVDDIRNWITDRSGLLLVDPYTIHSEIREVTDANYSTAQNSITLTATANMTVAGFSGCDGNSTPATATVTVDSVNTGVASNVTLDGVAIAFTGGSADTVNGLAEFLATSINRAPKLRRRFVATFSGAVVTIKGTFGSLVLDAALSEAHAAPLANPVAAPTVVASGSGHPTVAGAYRFNYSFVNDRGQTLLSPTTAVTITAGQGFAITTVSLPAGATAINWYVETGPVSEHSRLHTTNNGTGFTVTAVPLLDATLPPEINRTGAEVMRIRMAFTDRGLSRTNLTLSNVLRATYKWLLGNRKKTVNLITLKIHDANDDWRSIDLHFRDRRNIEKVKKEEPEEVNGQAINSLFQGLRIGSSKLGEFRDADFYEEWSSTRRALLLEEGDVVAVTDGAYQTVNLPVMIEEMNINPKNAGLPEMSFTGQKFSNFLYDDSIADRVTPIVTEF